MVRARSRCVVKERKAGEQTPIEFYVTVTELRSPVARERVAGHICNRSRVQDYRPHFIFQHLLIIVLKFEKPSETIQASLCASLGRGP
jgi:hypothetical protein